MDAEPMLRVESKFKNARLYNAIAERSVPLSRYHNGVTAGPIKAFCDLHQLSLMQVYQLLNLRKGPIDGHKQLRPICQQLAALLEADVEYLFPAELYQIQWPVRVVREINGELVSLANARMLALPPTQFQDVADHELVTVMETALQSLPPRERKVIEMRFGFGDGHEHTYQEAGEALGVTRSRAMQIEMRALRKLRHRSRSRTMKPFVIVPPEDTHG